MKKRKQLIEKYATNLKTKCNIKPEMDLLTTVTIDCRPSIYNKDASTVSASDASEVKTLWNNFLIKKLDIKGTPELNTAINKVLDVYGQSNRNKYRAVVYNLLIKHFAKESVFQN
jgi:hypothetical protein